MSEEDLTKLAKETKNTYHSKWQKKNRDKVRKSQEKYWRKKALAILEEQKN